VSSTFHATKLNKILRGWQMRHVIQFN